VSEQAEGRNFADSSIVSSRGRTIVVSVKARSSWLRDARAGLLLCVSVALASCSPPDVQPVAWTGIDARATIAAIESPTGEVNLESALEIGAAFVRSAGTIVLIILMIKRVLDLESDRPPSEGGGGTGGDLGTGTLESTNVFMELSCWGPQRLRPDLE
jgi:hypothetical protein